MAALYQVTGGMGEPAYVCTFPAINGVIFLDAQHEGRAVEICVKAKIHPG